MRTIYALIPLLFACGKVPTDDPPYQPDSPLAEKLHLYQSLSDVVRDPHGFVDADHCDSLLFSSLASFHKQIDIWSARDADGQWFRTPDHDCYPKRSDSSISRDMLLGALWYAWIHQERAIPESIYAYAIEHHMVMGDGVPTRTLMSVGLLATTAQMIFRLGGTDHIERTFSVTWLPGTSGFQRHVAAWHILLRMRLYDQIEESALQRLKDFAAAEPENPLYAYGAGDLERVGMLFSNARFYPVDRLPTSADRCEAWLIQRDHDSPGYQPCPKENRTHSGGELLSIGYLITEGK
jgi:hypothetical protein